ncbi:MAG: hypothetical protein FJW20_06945 [Acidimicrobiia bacterium]|nr:hypothetical protein [Acidimicrobiia bacterium]
MRTFRHASGAFFVLIILLASCGSKPQTKMYRIGLGPWVGFGPFYLAKEKGFFREAGVDVDLIVLTGVAERNSALKAGRIDGLAAPVDYFVMSAGNNLETKVVMAIDESTGGDGIVAKKGIQKFEDLRGKRLAFQRGLPSEFFVRAMLRQHGLKVEDLNTVDMETSEAGAAFITNKVDAAAIWEPWLTMAREEGGGHILASTSDHPDLIVDCLAFNNEVMASSREDVQKIVNALLKAIAYWKANAAEANQVMAPHFQVDAAKYGAILSGAKFCDLERNRSYFGAEGVRGPVYQVAERAAEIWKEAGVIGRAVKADSVVDPGFIHKAAR